MWTYEKNINHSLIRPKEEDYENWEAYQKAVMEYIYLKFKDTYKNGN
jgi:hypothetical protein